MHSFSYFAYKLQIAIDAGFGHRRTMSQRSANVHVLVCSYRNLMLPRLLVPGGGYVFFSKRFKQPSLVAADTHTCNWG